MSVIDDFLSNTDDETKNTLEHIRKLVHEYVGDVDEVMSYGMPGFRTRVDKKIVLGFNINKHTLALYPHSGQTLKNMKSDISPWRTALSALNFTPSHPIPDKIIKELLDVRMQEIRDGYGGRS